MIYRSGQGVLKLVKFCFFCRALIQRLMKILTSNKKHIVVLSLIFNKLSMFWNFDVRRFSSDVISCRRSNFFKKLPLRRRLSYIVFSIFFHFYTWISNLRYWTMLSMYRFFIQTGSTELEPPKLRQYFKCFLRFQATFLHTDLSLFYKTRINHL